MKKITKEFLKKHRACQNGYEWYLDQKTTDAKEIFKKLFKEYRLNDANWVICRMFNRKQKIKYAVYSAKQVLKIYEKKYPDDKRPREAIEAAEKCINNNTKKNRNAARAASAYTAYIATYATYATYAARAAADAAYTARAAARAASASARAATYAAYTSARASADAASARAAADATKKRKMQIKILNYGLKLLQIK